MRNILKKTNILNIEFIKKYLNNKNKVKEYVIDKNKLNLKTKFKLKEIVLLIRHEKYKGKVFEKVFYEIKAYLKIGLNLNESIGLVDEKFSKVKKQIKEKINEGNSLNKTIEDLFKLEKYEIDILKASEESGNLTSSIEKIINERKEKQEIKENIIGILTYPIILLVILIAYIIFSLFYLVPIICSLLKELDVKEGMLFSLLEISNLIKNNILIVILTLTFLFFTVMIISKKKELGKRILLGKSYKLFCENKEIRILKMYLSSGFNLLEAIDKTSNDFEIFKNIKELILEGNDLSIIFKRLNYSKLLVSLIRVNEQTGTLVEGFNKFYEESNKKVTDTLKRNIKLIEPIILIFTGLIVLLTVSSILSPIMEAFSKMQ